MDAVVVGIGVAAVTFVGGLVGLMLHRLLPEPVTSGPLRDMTNAVGGLLSLLTALVLGLLIWTAYGVYASQATAVRSLATQFLELDLAFADYGPDAAAQRTHLAEDVRRVVLELWGSDRDYAARNYSATIANWHARQADLKTLHANTDKEKQALDAATQAANAIARTRLQMAAALTDPVSRPLVLVVVAWAVCLFISYGLMHAKSLDALAALAVGAIAVGTAVYLLIDLSHPYSGLFQVSSDPITQTLEFMGK
jgi:Protein of unknown function (DUF4239)